MHVIAVASQKGGSGKTTLAGHVAVEAERAGAGPVALIDTDPQGSLSEWWNAREAETPVFAQTTPAGPRRRREAPRRPRHQARSSSTRRPRYEVTIAEVVSVADLVVIPARPSPHDLRAAGATVELVERLGKPIVFVVNAASPRAKITSEAVFALSQHGTSRRCIIHQRTDYAAEHDRRAHRHGAPGEDRATAEIAALWDYLRGRLKREYKTLFGTAPQPSAKPVFGKANAERVAVAS